MIEFLFFFIIFLGKASTISEVDHVISALPSYQLSTILKDSISSTGNVNALYNNAIEAVAEKLDEIAFVDVAVISMEYSGSPQVNLPHQGFGHLVPSIEPSNSMGVIYDSCCFPRHDRIDRLYNYATTAI